MRLKMMLGLVGVAIGLGLNRGLGGGVLSAQGAGEGRRPSPAHPVLVELFTSEGCSSCPAADDVLREIDGRRTETGQVVVGISEHVTYWNRLGWADPFSSEVYTARQDGYRSRFHIDSAYTPQVVVNGDREVLGSDRKAVLRAVAETDHAPGMAVHIESAKISGDTLEVRYRVDGGAVAGAELFAVVADDRRSSRVERGENAGRTLTHVAVARSLTRLGEIREMGEGSTGLHLQRRDGESKDQAPGGRHLVLFAQSPGSGRVVAIDVAALPG